MNHRRSLYFLSLLLLCQCALGGAWARSVAQSAVDTVQDTLEAEVEVVPVLTHALKDTLAEHTKLARRLSSDSRNPDFKTARKHVARLLYLADSLRCPMANHLVTAGDVENLAFNFERNKPALGKKTDEKECLAAAKRCYLYFKDAYELYHESPAEYGKEAAKMCKHIQPLAMQYYLLTKGFLVNAGQSYAKNDLVTTLGEFRMSYEGSVHPFLLEQHRKDPKHSADFEHYMADSTRNRTLYNCGSVAMALQHYDEALDYFDTLKVKNYELDKVYKNTLSIYYSMNDTTKMMNELRTAIKQMPTNTWFMKNLLQIHIDRQEWRQAQRLAASISELDSLDAQVICMKGQLYEHQGNTQQAIEIYKQSYALDSTQANVCSFIGRIYYNRAVQLKDKLYEQKRMSLLDPKLTPLYNQSQPWYERAFVLDTERKDKTIAMALREMLYFRFTKPECPNSAELIAQYNEVSRAYGMREFGR